MKLSMLVLLLAFSISPVIAADSVIVVVRHAEKSKDDPKDPGLSEQGQARANKLAEILKDARVSAAYATQYKRTLLTASPTATQNGFSVEVRNVTKDNASTYTAGLLNEIQKRHKGKTVLIVGHSNTVPELVKHLAGVDISPIGEDEYDRIYVITLGKQSRLVSLSYKP